MGCSIIWTVKQWDNYIKRRSAPTNYWINQHVSSEVKSEKAIFFAENNKQALDILSAKIDYMKDEIICLIEQNSKQQKHIWQNESYSRRNNLLFRGYDKSNQSCDVIV